MARRPGLPIIPASFFGIVLGLAGLGGTWRAAHQAWGLPAAVADAIMAVATLVWASLLLLYAWKWIAAREAALAELAHPVQCCFVGLAGVATMLVAGGAIPHSRTAAIVLFAAGCAFTFGFAVWRTGGLWLGGRDQGGTTAVLYLPSVAGSFVACTVGAALGWPDWGRLAFGSGLFSWLAIESVLLNRLLTTPGLPGALRPTLGIQLAPPAVGAVALLTVAPGEADLLAEAMIGYGLLQALVLLRLLRWITREPFTASYWSFAFGATALATAPLRLIAQGKGGAVEVVAPVLFVLANLLVLGIAAGTVFRAAQRRLFAPPDGGGHAADVGHATDTG
ncbi:tellurite resistance protein TehA [Azospirillum sp. TSO35-2]|nr:tellurite resistance protein TehA [Azospirillum sp. TSO35-2]